MLSLKIIDGIVEEPLGGAHRDPDTVIDRTGDVIAEALGGLAGMNGQEVRAAPARKIPRHRPVDSVENRDASAASSAIGEGMRLERLW